MVLKFYENYRNALPVLKVGHIIKCGAGSKDGSGFWVVEKVMQGRVKITETGAITKRQWVTKTATAYGQVSGSLDTERIVHLQYLSCLDANDAKLYWNNFPLFNPDTDSVVNSTIAPDSAPIWLDKWSYDQSMFVSVSIDAAVSQNFLVETANYEVKALKGTLPKKYLEITSSGDATFIELPEPEKTPPAEQSAPSNPIQRFRQRKAAGRTLQDRM